MGLLLACASVLATFVAQDARASASNDAPATATSLALGGAVSADSSAADPGLSPGEPAPSCTPISHSLWFRVEVPHRMRVTISSFGSKLDTVVALYDTDGLERACIDDADTGSQQAKLDVIVATGPYLVQIGSNATTTDHGGLLRLSVGASSVPIGDSPNEAIEIDLPTSVEIDLASYSADGADPDCVNQGSSAWFVFEPAFDGRLSLDADYVELAVGVYTPDLEELDCDYLGYPFGDEPPPPLLRAGEIYLVGVALLGDNASPPTVRVDLALDPPAPNDELVTATPIPVSTVTAGTLRGGTSSLYDPWDCSFLPGRSVWYRFTANETSLYAVQLRSNDQVVVGVFRDRATNVACGSGPFPLVKGGGVWIMVSETWPAFNVEDAFAIEVVKGTCAALDNGICLP